MEPQQLSAFRHVQDIARETVSRLQETLTPGMTLKDVRAFAESTLLSLGADSFWYHGVGAFVFAGRDTVRSVSGRNYQTPHHVFRQDDLLTIDLSPQQNGKWGDYARTIVLQQGRAAASTEAIRNNLWRRGLQMEEALHAELARFATPQTTFEELHAHMNAMIVSAGYANLDFLCNLGHSIERTPEARLYIEQGNKLPLGECNLFTFEPHIALPNVPYGYKMENIYYFDGDTLREL